jgi:hypothetical protein
LGRSEAAQKQSETQSLEHPGSVTTSLQDQVAREFSRALRRARQAADWGEPDLAVEWCRYAALLAWGTNPGFFYNHELEQLLAEIGRKHLGSGLVSASNVFPPQRFLHVMTAAFETGGHTRVVSRWIETCARHAPSEHHSILISAQNKAPLPAWLGRSAEKTGGKIIEFPPDLPWAQAATELRSRSLEYDAIVLHVHPYDLLPNLAYHDRPRPILFFRHADHAFNVGLDLARVIADFRPVGHQMSMHYGPDVPLKAMLPLPLLDEESIHCSKREARERLGLSVDGLIALTIGSSYKFEPTDGYSFAAVVRSLCEANSRLRIVAVGPSESTPFPGLRESMDGRFLPVGIVRDPDVLELYYRSADIYFDAYPNGSGIAVLDAALHGLPILRFYNPQWCLMWSDDPGLDSVWRGMATQEELVATAQEWLEWPEEKRLELGARFREVVLRDHCGTSWRSKWLDPAVKALVTPADSTMAQAPISAVTRQQEFPGLGITFSHNDWPSGMFIAGTLNPDRFFPTSIRLSGALRSIQPLFFDRSGERTSLLRLSMFAELIAACVPDHVFRTAPRRLWNTFHKMLRRRRLTAR